MPSLPIVQTQVTLRGNVGSLDAPTDSGPTIHSMACPVCPLGPHRSLKQEMWILWTYSGRPIYSHLALGAGYCTEGREWSKKSQKIEEANDIPNLPIVPTQVTLRRNVGSLDAPRVAHLFTFSPRGQGIVLRGP